MYKKFIAPVLLSVRESLPDVYIGKLAEGKRPAIVMVVGGQQ